MKVSLGKKYHAHWGEKEWLQPPHCSKLPQESTGASSGGAPARRRGRPRKRTQRRQRRQPPSSPGTRGTRQPCALRGDAEGVRWQARRLGPVFDQADIPGLRAPVEARTAGAAIFAAPAVRRWLCELGTARRARAPGATVTRRAPTQQVARPHAGAAAMTELRYAIGWRAGAGRCPQRTRSGWDARRATRGAATTGSWATAFILLA